MPLMCPLFEVYQSQKLIRRKILTLSDHVRRTQPSEGNVELRHLAPETGKWSVTITERKLTHTKDESQLDVLDIQM